MKSKFKKFVIPLAYTILIGSLGSAFWEIALKPLLAAIPSILIYLFGIISNSIYKQIPLSGHTTVDLLARYCILFLYLTFIAGPNKLSMVMQKMSDDIPKYLTYPFLLIAVYIITTHISCDITARSTLRDISIVAPYISDQEYKQLQSDFYSMNSKSDYDELRFFIDKIIEENNLSE